MNRRDGAGRLCEVRGCWSAAEQTVTDTRRRAPESRRLCHQHAEVARAILAGKPPPETARRTMPAATIEDVIEKCDGLVKLDLLLSRGFSHREIDEAVAAKRIVLRGPGYILRRWVVLDEHVVRWVEEHPGEPRSAHVERQKIPNSILRSAFARVLKRGKIHAERAEGGNRLLYFPSSLDPEVGDDVYLRADHVRLERLGNGHLWGRIYCGDKVVDLHIEASGGCLTWRLEPPEVARALSDG